MRIHGLRVSFDARTFAWTVLIYAGMGAIFTGVSLATSAPADQIGTFRQLPAIPGHVAELALAALAIGLAAVVVGGAMDATLALLIPALTVLTDIDHLPSFLGYPQPIRPDHSLLFLAATVAVASVAIRSPSADAAIVSAFCAHLGVDSGVFPPWSPLSFGYADITWGVRWAFLASAVVFAVSAGLLKRRERRGGS